MLDWLDDEQSAWTEDLEAAKAHTKRQGQIQPGGIEDPSAHEGPQRDWGVCIKENPSGRGAYEDPSCATEPLAHPIQPDSIQHDSIQPDTDHAQSCVNDQEDSSPSPDSLSERPTQRVSAGDKRIINGKTDVNQLVPFRYRWAWEQYLKQCSAHWMPQEVDLGLDASVWNSSQDLDDRIRQTISHAVADLGLFDSLRLNEWILGAYRQISAPECRQYLLRQSFDLGIRQHSFHHIVGALGLEPANLAQELGSLPAVHARNEFLNEQLSVLSDPKFSTGTPERDGEFFNALVTLEFLAGSVFYSASLSQMASLAKGQNLPGLLEIGQRLQKDRQSHCAFGMNLVTLLKSENPYLWNDQTQSHLKSLFNKAVAIEQALCSQTMPGDCDFFDSSHCSDYIKSVANHWSSNLGLGLLFQVPSDAANWGRELFEGRVSEGSKEEDDISLQSGATLSW